MANTVVGFKIYQGRFYDSKTTTTGTTRFSQYYKVRSREPALFWPENAIAAVILRRDLGKQVIKC